MSQTKDRRLAKDVKWVGQILGDCIRTHLGSKGFEAVESSRQLSKKARSGDLRSGAQLQQRISRASDQQLLDLAKAFCEFMRISNTAEQTHRLRLLEEGKVRESDRLFGVLSRFEKEVGRKHLLKALLETEIDLVLTAHPTEAMPTLTRRACRQLADGLWQGDEARLKLAIETLWASPSISAKKPTPLEEAITNFSIVEDSLWESVPRLARLCEDTLNEELPADWSPFRFSSWMGGDRDGNPFVTAEMTKAVRREARLIALRLFGRDLDRLLIELKLPFLMKDKDLTQELQRWRDRLRTEERELRENLPVSQPVSEKELTDFLKALRERIAQASYHAIARGPLTSTLRRLKAFGLGLLRMDLRQASDIHEQIVEALAVLPSGRRYSEMTEDEKVEFLKKPIKLKEKPVLSPEGEDYRDLFAQMAREGTEGFNVLIVSMAESASDLLEADWLQRAFGLKAPLPVVPLFETPEALADSVSVMKRYWSETKSSGARSQIVMLGYSDSTKRGGLLASAWTLHRIQREMEAQAKKAGVSVIFFHGRGGSIGRGGGPVREAMRSMPVGTDLKRLRVTEQGESIESKFGLPGLAVRSFELYLMAVLEARLEKPHPRRDLWAQKMDQVAEASQKAFREFVYENPDFNEFFRQVTPVQELGLLKIGSRPSRRKKGIDLESLRAIPWIFSWTQNRALLASWLGTGEGLSQLSLRELQDMQKSWVFFQSVLGLIEMVMAKADMKTFRLYADQLLEPELQGQADRLIKNYEQTVRLIRKVRGEKSLLTFQPALRESIEIRTPYVEVMNRLQIEILKRRHAGSSSDVLEQAMALTISGIAAGMRNTG